jgi:hypothetical protein
MTIFDDLKEKLVEVEHEIEVATAGVEAEAVPIEAEVAQVVEEVKAEVAEVKQHVNPILQMAIEQAAARLSKESNH